MCPMIPLGLQHACVFNCTMTSHGDFPRSFPRRRKSSDVKLKNIASSPACLRKQCSCLLHCVGMCVFRRGVLSHYLTAQEVCLWAKLMVTHRPLTSSFLGLLYRILNILHKKELLRGLWLQVLECHQFCP